MRLARPALRRPCVATIALLSGGVSRGELETAGARAVYENARDLCEHIHDSPIAALVRLLPTG